MIESPSAATAMRSSSASAGIGLLCDLHRNALVLAHDVVALQPGDDALDLGIFVTRMDGELMRLRPKLLVFGTRHAESLDAGGIAAFTDEVESRFDIERLGETFDPLVDLPKDGLVQSDALFA